MRVELTTNIGADTEGVTDAEATLVTTWESETYDLVHAVKRTANSSTYPEEQEALDLAGGGTPDGLRKLYALIDARVQTELAAQTEARGEALGEAMAL